MIQWIFSLNLLNLHIRYLLRKKKTGTSILAKLIIH